jgi:hypothetical protein
LISSYEVDIVETANNNGALVQPRSRDIQSRLTLHVIEWCEHRSRSRFISRDHLYARGNFQHLLFAPGTGGHDCAHLVEPEQEVDFDLCYRTAFDEKLPRPGRASRVRDGQPVGAWREAVCAKLARPSGGTAPLVIARRCRYQLSLGEEKRLTRLCGAHDAVNGSRRWRRLRGKTRDQNQTPEIHGSLSLSELSSVTGITVQSMTPWR